MSMRWFYLFLFSSAFFLFLIVVEFFCCGAFYRFARPSQGLILDAGSGLAALAFCYGALRKPMKAAFREKIPLAVVLAVYLVLSALVGCFFRFSLQLANGLLDFSDSDSRVVVVTAKKTSNFGGSLQDGLNPTAHLVYFQDKDFGGEDGEVLTRPDFYYFVDIGTRIGVTLRRGFFHWPWVEDCQMLNNPHLPYSAPGSKPDGSSSL